MAAYTIRTRREVALTAPTNRAELGKALDYANRQAQGDYDHSVLVEIRGDEIVMSWTEVSR